MKKPEGFMLFFDRLEPMRNLSNEETGTIFKAIWEYAESGVIPELSNNLLPFWTMLRLSVDRNVVSYNETSVKNRYNRYKGEVKKRNEEAADIWEWWAAQPDYTPAIFKKEVWYEDAAASYQRRTTNVNDGQQSYRNVTNQTETQPEPETQPNPNPSPSESKGGVGGADRDEMNAAWNRYLDARESVGRQVKDEEEGKKIFERVKTLSNNDPMKYAATLDKMTRAVMEQSLGTNGLVGRIAAGCSL